MRLLNVDTNGELSLTKDLIEDIPRYAILSHTWGEDEDEVTFNDFQDGSGKSKTGYAKIQFCREQAERDGLQHFWVDTCCIDKANHTELSEAITSMFAWYRDAVKCYVYLSDVSARKCESNGQTERTWELAFRNSRWFTRGWTLQELIAPVSVEFFAQGELLGDKNLLEGLVHDITGIPYAALCGATLSNFSVNERLRWATKRNTRRKEDKAYCLLGIFGVFMSPLYGEGENAFIRLKKELGMPTTTHTNLQTTILDEATKKSLSDLGATDPGLDMDRIEISKDSLLKECYEWILHDPVLHKWRYEDSNPLLWISGDPGKGKTMLMIALIREVSKGFPNKSSALTFFFCQNTDSRLNSVVSILRGLIWKFAMNEPPLAAVFHNKYESIKNVFSGPNAVFALFSVLSAMLEAGPETFIFIDALDECHAGPEREQLLQLIMKQATSSSKAKWLVSSRNNQDIKQLLKPSSQILSLELNRPHVSNAVVAFVKEKVIELTAMKDYSPDLAKKVEDELISRADSTFLWVALACKRLRQIRTQKTLSVLATLPPRLNELYARMMKEVLQCEDNEDWDFCVQILRSVTLAFRPLSMRELITVTNLSMELLKDNGLCDLIELCGSFITVRNGYVYFVHQSAKDYLASDRARALFPTHFQTYHGLVVSHSLDAMSRTLERDICNLRYLGSPPSKVEISTSLKAISYACSFWVEHLVEYLNNSPEGICYKEYIFDHGRVHDFLLEHLLHWIEALSLIGEVNKGILGLQILERMFERLITRQSEIPLLQNFVHDAVRVLRQFRPAVEEAPLQIYCTTLVFSPETSLVRQNFKQETPRWISPLPQVRTGWSSCLQTLEGHTNSVNSVVFSPSGQQLASCSGDYTVRLWDVASGACLQTLEGHTDRVYSVVFSPGGQQLASCSDDHTVRLWDVASGACLQTLEGHTDRVYSVVFSPSGQQLASCSGDHTVRLWDVASGACLQTLEGHTNWVCSVVFSPSGQQLASCSGDHTVRLWDVASGACLQTLEGHTNWVYSVVFSPGGQQLASCSGDHTVRLWDVASGTCLQTIKCSTNSVVFSDDGSNLVTDFGVWSVGQPGSDATPKQTGFSIRHKWISWNGIDILWLPPEYRAYRSTINGNRIGVGCVSGLVYVLNFHPDRFPN